MKKVIVVGGSSGIGASVIELLKNDYEVINMSRRKNEGIENNIYVDVTDIESIKMAFEDRADIYALIYCAGIVDVGNIIDLSPEMFKKTIDTNLVGAFLVTKEFIKVKAECSNIVFIASTSGTRPQPLWAGYAASKAGLINFALTASEEFKESGIDVFCVTPGRCATELRRKIAPDEDPSKIMQPSSVAEFIKYLIEFGKHLRGQSIIIK